ncbi:MAG: peptidase [Bacteroidales bacterium]|nr:peptidase [Bacteroidales bacterium]
MRKIFRKLFNLIIFLSVFHLTIDAQNQYTGYNSMVNRIRALSDKYPKACSVRTLSKTEGGKEIWLITIGSGKMDSKPGIVIAGGVEGRHILGRELAFGMASSLLKESSSVEVKELLDKITFYILPDLSPDASEQFFSEMKYERTGNARATDEDHDFVTDEDGFEDLNKDGLITLVRVEDPAGKFIKSSEDDRIMAEADLSKGQSGKYLVFSEGIDNDKDGNFNEDGPGGVDFNRNFTFNYESFGPESGMYPVSEPETRAAADFLFDRFNVYAVLTFGPQDNLGEPLKSASGGEKNGIIKSILKEDEALNKLLSDKYHEITGMTGAPPSTKRKGDFFEWAYFHYGRYSFSSPGWWFSAEKDKNDEVAFLKYAEKNRKGDAFIPWTPVIHPDFPGKKAEVGGIKPFIMTNPPADSLDVIIMRNYNFIKAVASMHPELEFLDINVENQGEGIQRISLKLHNSGIFATSPKIGEENMWTRVMRITAETSDGQSIISGQKVQKVERLEGSQSAEFSWLISGKGSVKITAGALNTGSVSTTIELR